MFSMATQNELFEQTVLIVDDEDINRKMMANILAYEYKIIYASDGKEAMEKIHKYGHRLSLVLLDLFMPNMSGFDVLRQMNKERLIAEIPVIVLTSDKTSEIESLHLGAADF